MNYLIEVERDRIGVSPKPDRVQRVVDLLIENRDWVTNNPDRWPHELGTDDKG